MTVAGTAIYISAWKSRGQNRKKNNVNLIKSLSAFNLFEEIFLSQFKPK